MRLILFLFLAIPAISLAGDDPQIQVQGSCDLKVIPDRASVTFTAENLSKNHKEAIAKTNSQMTQLENHVLSMKLADIEIKTTQYSVSPIREWEKEKMVDKGFRASVSLEVTTSDIQKLGEATVKAASVGVTNISGLVTFLSLEKSQKEYLKCLDIAANDARAKADQLGKKLGFKVGDVHSVIESKDSTSMPPMPAPMAMMKTASMDMESTRIEAGTQKFSTQIQVIFKIK